MPIALPKELTAGQTEPVPELLQPYENFPKKITGPTVWQAEDFRSRPDLWQRQWTPELIQQLEEAFDKFEASGKTLPEINKSTFPLPTEVVEFLSSIRQEVVNGQGFILIEGLPVADWPVFKSAAIYLAIGTIFGNTLSQNGKGHVLGHVKVGISCLYIGMVSIADEDRTSARQYFHCDAADIVGLLCLHKALEGGESDVVSSHNLWNTLQAERPDVAELLAKPNWYFDRKGEVSEGQKPWVQRASQGGWKRPFPDSANEKRGGIQVNDQEETCPLDAE
ncbi:hypothetical protein QFC19_006362 [Naganishia cerealis]|uniref:Uncharacterized protein n=1 Tax=Naganishia cerealis TaxID=610337 RepID=A0ACC2VH53_9TREE|nr:hypothetical protein QFC19_006362 [Naganishia cerealis]